MEQVTTLRQCFGCLGYYSMLISDAPCLQMTEEQAEETALATVLIDAMNEETDRAQDFLMGPKHAAEHPKKFFTKVPACD